MKDAVLRFKRFVNSTVFNATGEKVTKVSAVTFDATPSTPEEWASVQSITIPAEAVKDDAHLERLCTFFSEKIGKKVVATRQSTREVDKYGYQLAVERGTVCAIPE